LISIVSYIILFLFGVLIGNFTTTIFHRLPRNIMISGFDQKTTRPPFCSNCGHLLRFYEYLPILSWFSTFGKCNYCHTPITKSYIMLEVLLGFTAMILYFLLGQNLEYFFLYFCFAALILLNIFIYLEHNFIPAILTLSIIILGMIFRTLTQGEIFSWLACLLLAFIISIWIVQRHHSNYYLAHLILPASLWCNNYGLLIFGLILLGLYLVKIISKKITYIIAIVTMFILSLYFL
jgi:leader peptidase (prepilin peptidase)/N-methyltransferase